MNPFNDRFQTISTAEMTGLLDDSMPEQSNNKGLRRTMIRSSQESRAL